LDAGVFKGEIEAGKMTFLAPTKDMQMKKSRQTKKATTHPSQI
jgi:hypothetical protein